MACVHYYINKGFNVTGFFVDYGQAAAKNELKCCNQIGSHFNIKIKKANFVHETAFESGEIKGRNCFLIIATLLSFKNFTGLISMGIHSGTSYYDCSIQFVNEIQTIIDGYSNGTVILDIPFLEWNKKLIIEYCNLHKIPLEMTYSCESGGDNPCNKCLSCLDRLNFYENKNFGH